MGEQLPPVAGIGRVLAQQKMAGFCLCILTDDVVS